MNNTFGRQTSTSRKGAEFSTDKEFLESSVLVNSTASKLDYSGIPLDMDASSEGVFATSNDELHCFIVGDTGCGKTRRLIVPAIRLMGKSGESMVISDPKGELYRKTADALKYHGYDIKVVNMRNPGRGQRWNPFTLVEKLYNSRKEEDRDRALLIIEDIVNVMHQPNRSSHDPYWDNMAAHYIKGLIFTLLGYGGHLSFASIADFDKEVTKVIEEDPETFSKFINVQEQGSSIKENFYGLVGLLGTDGGRTLGCIVSEAQNILAQYTKQSAIRNLLEISDFDMEDIGKKPTALYIVLPDDSEALYNLATLMVKQIYSCLINIADNIGGKLPNKVSFILDEFANFTPLPSIGSMLTASRSRGIRFVLVCQNVGQLEEKYGEYGAETIRANCRVWVYMGCRNLEFLKMLQDLSGIHVERYGGNEYPLIDIDMLQRLKQGEVFVWNDRCSPKLCHLPDYSQYNFGKESLQVQEIDLPPYREALDSESLDAKNFLRDALECEGIPLNSNDLEFSF